MATERDSSETPSLVRTSLAVLAFGTITALLYYGRPILIPFLLAAFIFSVFTPILDWLVLKLRFPRLLAVLVTFVLVVIIIGVFAFGLFEAMIRAVSTAADYGQNLADMVHRLLSYVRGFGLEMSYDRLIESLQQELPSVIVALGTGWDVVFGLFLTLVFALFLLASRNPRVQHKGIYAAVDTDIRRYLVRKVVLSLFVGVVVWLVLWAFGLRLAMVFGLLAFLLEFIPTIGPTIATLLPLPVALAQFEQSLWYAILIIVTIEVFELTMGYIVEPRVLGGGVDLHPVAVLLAIGYWSLVWGIGGAFLAVPVTAVIRVVLLQTATFRPIGELLSGTIPAPDEQSERPSR